MRSSIPLQANVIPDALVLTFDVRLPPTTDLEAWERRVEGWLEEAGEGITLHWIQKMTDQTMTPVPILITITTH